MTSRRLAGARAIVTGASSGIGQALARELARRGCDVVLVARRAERLKSLAAEIERLGRRAVVSAGDVADPQVRQASLAAAEQLGGLDLLVNNAGIGALGPFAESDEARLRRIMEVNFFAPAQWIRAALPLLRRAAQPMIVNIGSVLGHCAVPQKSEYCASKFALRGFSDALRCELAGQGIDLLVVSPSTTASEFFDNFAPDRSGAARVPWHAQSAEAVARKTVSAICRGRREIILTPGGKLLVWGNRLCPSLISWWLKG